MARNAIVPVRDVSAHDGAAMTPASQAATPPAGRPARLVRIEEPLALFVPDRYLTSTVPLPLYLLELVPGSVKADYERTPTGIVANESDRIRRRTLRYPGGVRCDVEVHGDQVRGLPTTFDYDYFLALCRIADAGGVDEQGYFIDPGYRAVLRAAGRPDDAIGGDQVEAVKRAFARFAGLIIHTKLDLDYAAAGEQVRSGGRGPLVPDGTPAFRERESKHWVLEYDVEAERRRTSGGVTTSYNAIERLRINPVWLNQAAAGIAAWLDVDLHNGLRSGYAKRLLQLFTVRAARGWRVLEPWVLPLRELYGLLEVPAGQWGKTQTRTGIASALGTLAEQGVLGTAEILKLGKGRYEVRLSAGERLLAAGLQRGSGSLDSPADRTLLWHLRAVGFSPTQARDLVRRRPDQVRTVLRRAYYLQAVKGGMSNGRRIEDWNAWVRAAIEGEWAFADPEWTRWLAAQVASAEQGRLDGPLADVTLLGTGAAGVPPVTKSLGAGAEPIAPVNRQDEDTSAPEEQPIEYADDPWGRAVAEFVAERGDPRIYTSWLARTALEQVTDTTVDVVAEDDFVAEWVARKYGERLTAILSASAGRALELRFATPGRPLPPAPIVHDTAESASAGS
jgi:hypothetical protein